MLQIIARFSALCIISAVLHLSARCQTPSLTTPVGDPPTPSPYSEEFYERLEQFLKSDSQTKRRVLENAREELAALKVREAEWLAAESDIDAQVDAAREQLKTKAGAFGELLGQFRLAAGKVEWRIRSSLSSFEYPGRADALRDFSTSRMLPTRTDLKTLPKSIIQEMKAQSEVKTLTADVVHAASGGRIRTEQLIRVGVFQAATVDRSEFVIIQKIGKQEDAPRMLLTFPGQPDDEVRAAMAQLVAAGDGEIVRVPIDPTRGKVLTEKVFGRRSR